MNIFRAIASAMTLVVFLLVVNARSAEAVATATVRFTGKVSGPEGKPLSGTKVAIGRVSGAPIVGDIKSLHTQSDASGNYELPLSLGASPATEINCELVFEQKGFITAKKELTTPLASAIKTLDATLTNGLVLSGTIQFDLSAREFKANPALKDTPPVFRVTGPNFDDYYLADKGGSFEIYVPVGEYTIAAQLLNQSLKLSGIKAGTTNLLLKQQEFVWSEKTVGKVFDDFWQAMDSQYSYFFLKPDVDWQALKDKHRPRAIQATNATDLVKVLQQMLVPLQDLHVWIDSPSGKLSTHTNSYVFNGNGNTTRQAIQNPAQFGKFAVVGTTQEGFGYFLMLKQSNADPELVKQTVDALRKLRNVPGFIVDLRAANGGSEPLAQEIASVFCAKDTLYAKQKYRNGPGHQDFTKAYNRVLRASSNAYTNPIVCILGPGTISSGEGFAKMMKALPQVTTVGMPTRGASGNPKAFTLEGTGISVVFSRWVDLMPNGQTFESQGIPPDVLVDEPPSAYLQLDPTMEKAFEVLRQKVKEISNSPN